MKVFKIEHPTHGGTTIEAIAKKLKISTVAAQSLLADGRRKGVKIKFADGVYRVA